jgi:hypothetical protein
LIQTKLVLLKGEVESCVAGDAASEQEFLELYDSIKRVCDNSSTVEVDLLIGDLEKFKQALNDKGMSQEGGNGWTMGAFNRQPNGQPKGID